MTRRYAVKIPAGAKDGTRVRLKGKGEPGANGGPAGDLFVVVSVDPSPLYERRDADLVLDVPVTYPEAALGATVEIPTPDGPVNLKVPAGTESGKLLRVKGRGAPKLKGGGKGDLLARIKVTVPQKLTKAEKEALEGYDSVLRERPATGRSVRRSSTHSRRSRPSRRRVLVTETTKGSCSIICGWQVPLLVIGRCLVGIVVAVLAIAFEAGRTGSAEAAVSDRRAT